MSSLARDAANFKSALARQDFSSWHSNPSNAQPQSPSAGEPSGSGANQKKNDPSQAYVVYSQPADTGTGANINTQLVYCVDHLKSMGGPTRLQDIAIMTNTPLLENALLLEKFKAHDRVIYNPKSDTYQYKFDYQITNKAQLLTEIQRQSRKGGGVSIKMLKESWKDAQGAIDELEKEGEVYISRTARKPEQKKESKPIFVFWNEIKPHEPGGAKVEDDFLKLWTDLKVPEEPDLLKALAQEGLQATAAESIAPKPPTTKKKGKRSAGKQRQARITNTHLKGEIDLSRDYAPPPSNPK